MSALILRGVELSIGRAEKFLVSRLSGARLFIEKLIYGVSDRVEVVRRSFCFKFCEE